MKPLRTFGVAAWLALSATAPGRTAMFVNLGTLSGASEAWAVSGDGQVVVGDSGGQAFAWSAQTGMVGIGGTSARGVSSNGQYICGYTGSVGSSTRAVRWSAWSAGGMQDLNTFQNGSDSVANGISGDGSIVVGNAFNGDISQPDTVAYRWTAGSGAASYGATYATGPAAGAQAITPGGSVMVGNVGVAFPIARRWPQSGDPYLIPGRSSAQAVNADGSVIVGYDGQSAFRWENGVVTDLPGVPGATSAVARGVSGDGSIVIGEAAVAGGSQAFIWSDSTGTRNLRDVLISLGAAGLESWSLTSATGISADGSVIVGRGLYQGQQLAWAAVVPEPGALVVVVAAFPWRRRRITLRTPFCSPR